MVNVDDDISYIRRLKDELNQKMDVLQSLADRINRLPQARNDRCTLSRYYYYLDCDSAGWDCQKLKERCESHMEHFCGQTLDLRAVFLSHIYVDDDDYKERVRTETDRLIEELREFRAAIDDFLERHNRAVDVIAEWACDLDSRDCYACVTMFQVVGNKEVRLIGRSTSNW